MKNEESWNTFAQSGKVSDYLTYAGVNNNRESFAGLSGAAGSLTGKERGQRERTSEGYGAFGSYHW